MTPWEKLDVAHAIDGTELSLWRRGTEHVIRAGTLDLMSSRVHGSEEILAELGCAGLQPDASVLVGGLGMGFTLRRALDLLAPTARVVVAEVHPSVVAWVRGPLCELADRPLDDPRVTVDARDVALTLGDHGPFDAILLDVDNGPSAVSQRSNARLYGSAGIARMTRALRPGGKLLVWSARDDRRFSATLASAGLRVETAHARANRADGARHVVFVATSPS
jgi:spermidine synthase